MVVCVNLTLMKGCARWHRQSSPQSGGETNIAVSSPLSGDGTSSSPLDLNMNFENPLFGGSGSSDDPYFLKGMSKFFATQYGQGGYQSSVYGIIVPGSDTDTDGISAYLFGYSLCEDYSTYVLSTRFYSNSKWYGKRFAGKGRCLVYDPQNRLSFDGNYNIPLMPAYANVESDGVHVESLLGGQTIPTPSYVIFIGTRLDVE